MTYDFDTATYEVVPCTIQDAPKYPHRGLMVDSGRHFLPVAPLVTRRGRAALRETQRVALAPHGHAVVPRRDAVAAVVVARKLLEAGALLDRGRQTSSSARPPAGVRVVPSSTRRATPRAGAPGYPSVCPAPTCKTPLDVSKAETFAVLDDVLGDAAKLFPDAFVHLGGDEVDTSCWAATPSIQQWLQARNYTTADAYSYFVSTAAKIARSHQKRPIQWAEVFDEFGATLDKSTVVHVWKPSTNITEVVESGYDCLVNVGYVATHGT